MKKLIELKNVYKTYNVGESKTVALNNVSLDVYKNEFISIVGTSGSGKSTLMNIIGCLDIQTSGTYKLDEINIRNYSTKDFALIRNKYIGFVFQQYFLLPDLTVIENVELPLLYNGISEEMRKTISREKIKKLGILEKENMFPNQLSGGQQQRVAIARALATDAPIILADEPTGALDSTTSKEVLDIFEDLNISGKTIIIITHDINVANRAKRIIKIHDGKIIETDEIRKNEY